MIVFSQLWIDWNLSNCPRALKKATKDGCFGTASMFCGQVLGWHWPAAKNTCLHTHSAYVALPFGGLVLGGFDGAGCSCPFSGVVLE